MAARAVEAPQDAARRILSENSYATLATADAGGRPWATPVWFAERDLRDIVWVSRRTRRHSQNVAERPEIALVVFDSTSVVGSANAVYVEADAAEVAEDELGDALAVLTAKTDARGMRPWLAGSLSGDAPHRLYRARATNVWVLDEHENRTLVPDD